MTFRENMEKNQKDFPSMVHAAFTLNTTLTRYGRLTDEQKWWLKHAYPNSKVDAGVDIQGGAYYEVTPRF
jgi:hypothetical protein